VVALITEINADLRLSRSRLNTATYVTSVTLGTSISSRSIHKPGVWREKTCFR
jgi:hypothetical protein